MYGFVARAAQSADWNLNCGCVRVTDKCVRGNDEQSEKKNNPKHAIIKRNNNCTTEELKTTSDGDEAGNDGNYFASAHRPIFCCVVRVRSTVINIMIYPTLMMMIRWSPSSSSAMISAIKCYVEHLKTISRLSARDLSVFFLLPILSFFLSLPLPRSFESTRFATYALSQLVCNFHTFNNWNLPIKP